MAKIKVGIRKFRSSLADYITSRRPVTVTCHGEAVGVFIPTDGEPDVVSAALKKVSAEFERLRAARKIDTGAMLAMLAAKRRLGETDGALPPQET